MRTHRKIFALRAFTALVATLALAGCFNDDNDGEIGPVVTPPPVVATVPDSAGVSITSFVSYLLSLSMSDESNEPLVIKDTFAVPPDETAEPSPLV